MRAGTPSKKGPTGTVAASPAAATTRSSAGTIARSYGWIIMRLRLIIALGWIAAAAAATLYLPLVGATSGQEVQDLVPERSRAVATEQASLRLFSVPILSRIAIVQRNPKGLTPQAQARVYDRALRVDLHQDPQARQIDGALPLTNTLGLVPASRERSTTAVTYLFFRPGHLTFAQQAAAARSWAAREVRRPGDSLIGVTGPIPARLRQTALIERALPWVEVATVLLIGVIMGMYFRSPGPPLLTLAAAALAYLVSVRVVAWTGNHLGLILPRDLEPVVVVLLLGIVTDYSVFFLSGYRYRMAAGQPRVAAAQATTSDFVPIIFTAGLIVAAGTAALAVASQDFLRAFGPALAITVLITLLVAITFIPSSLAMLGRALYWPNRSPGAAAAEARSARTGSEGATATMEQGPPAWRTRLARLMTAKPVAAVIALLCLGCLGAAATGLARTRLGFTLVHGLPAGSEEARAAAAAEDGFARGILSPTEIVLRGPAMKDRLAQVGELERRLRAQPGVAGVLGPDPSLAGVSRAVFLSSDGGAARLVLVLDSDPLGGPAVGRLTTLEEAMPRLLAGSGLSGVEASFAGDTALAGEAIHETLHDLGRAALAALAVDLLLLIIFLHAVLAPVYLLMASVLGLAAALGITTWVFQVLLGHGEITYYVPFGVGILLIALGSDYNVFVVGRIWEEARARPLREAVAVAAPRAARTITLAGMVLAGSFALLALVPLVQFREFAFAMAVGVLLDTFVLRSLLVPALVSLFGRSSWWPWRPPPAAAASDPPVPPDGDP